MTSQRASGSGKLSKTRLADLRRVISARRAEPLPAGRLHYAPRRRKDRPLLYLVLYAPRATISPFE